MRKFVSIIIISILIKYFVSECEKNDEGSCIGRVSGVTTCSLEGEECVEKTICEEKENPNETIVKKFPH